MTYKAVFIDADNTLLDSDHNIPEDNKKAIHEAHNKGVKIIICSGRSYINIIDFAKELGLESEGNYIASFNGAIILGMNNVKFEIIKENKLKKSDAEIIIKELKKYDVDIIAYNDPTYTIIEKENETTDNYYSITKMPHEVVNSFSEAMNDEIPKMMAIADHDLLEKIKTEIKPIIGDDINVFFSMNTMIEFTHKNAKKGDALHYLCDILNISSEETIAIGDNDNDTSMIEAAGLGVAIANATDNLKKVADYVTKADNNQSGVAEVINKFILKK